MNRYLVFIIASMLPLALFSWFAPSPSNQLDFWLLWMGAMLLLALPTVYAEIALAHRSQLPPLQGMQKLTREADVSQVWRGFSWISTLAAVLLASGLIASVAQTVTPMLINADIHIPVLALAVGLAVLAVIMSVWGSLVAIAGLILIIAGLGLSVSQGVSGLQLQITQISLGEWGRAMMLALVSVGAGSGLYWFASVMRVGKTDNKTRASLLVLPIWGVQFVMGLLALLVTAITNSHAGIPNVLSAVGVLCVSATLLYFANQQLLSVFGNLHGQSQVSEQSGLNKIQHIFATAKALLATLLLTGLLVLVPQGIQQALLVLLTGVTVLILSVFTGWKMKISHLRKSMNFGSELTYNIWRVAIRLVVPLGVVFGLIGWVTIWFGA